MSDEKGRRARSSQRLGVASYSGREGRVHYFSVAFKDGSSELLTLQALRARITQDIKKGAVTKASAKEDGDLQANMKGAASKAATSQDGALQTTNEDGAQREAKKAAANATAKEGVCKKEMEVRGIRQRLEQAMPGMHDESKLRTLERAVQEDNVGNGGVCKGDVDRLGKMACLSEGTVFLPWEWEAEATEAVITRARVHME